VATRSHLSIGEVLSLLQEEFPDVTISKIRFLESQGLVDPERTPSGYRKFYDSDIERLRWVLRQQRDAFLPLKVIKGRLEGQGDLLEDQEAGLVVPPSPAEGSPGDPASPDEMVRVSPGRSAQGGEANGAAAHLPGPAASAEDKLFDLGPARRVPPAPGVPGAAGAGRRAVESEPRAGAAGAPPVASPGPTGPQLAGRGRHSAGAQEPGDTDGELSLEELVREAGVDLATVQELERFGLVTPRTVGGITYYNAQAAVIARVALAFARHGVEARHLRAFKGAAEREAGLVQQVVMPLFRQRNPQARRAAQDAVEEMSRLGGELRAALLASALSELR
jgi:DNA-binding transcriptional MerR regulator